MTTRTLSPLDIIIAGVSAAALIIVHLIDPDHSAQHNISDHDNKNVAYVLLLLIEGVNMFLVAAVMYSLRSFAGIIWDMIGKHGKRG